LSSRAIGFAGLQLHQRILGQFAVELGDFLVLGAGAGFLQALGSGDRAAPFLFALEDLQQRAACLHAVLGVDQQVEGFLGAVEQAGFQVVHAQFVLGVHLLLQRQVGARQQVLVDADGALGLAAAAEQVTEREVHVGRFGSSLTISMKASMALSGCSLSRKFRPLK
jgi:hypothetical protein